jgi:hypothetical protein
MKVLLLLLLALTFAACSGITPIKPSKNLDLFLIQRLDYGNIKRNEIIRLIGEPNQVISLKRNLAGKEAWIYSETEGSRNFERLGLMIDQKTGIVLSATWSVRANDPLFKKDSALSYFQNAKFSKTPAGQVAKDYYSDDSIYSDPQLGIVIHVDGAKQTTQSISFDAPVRSKLAISNKNERRTP